MKQVHTGFQPQTCWISMYFHGSISRKFNRLKGHRHFRCKTRVYWRGCILYRFLGLRGMIMLLPAKHLDSTGWLYPLGIYRNRNPMQSKWLSSCQGIHYPATICCQCSPEHCAEHQRQDLQRGCAESGDENCAGMKEPNQKWGCIQSDRYKYIQIWNEMNIQLKVGLGLQTVANSQCHSTCLPFRCPTLVNFGSFWIMPSFFKQTHAKVRWHAIKGYQTSSRWNLKIEVQGFAYTA